MYESDVRRQTDVRQHHRFMPRLLGAGHFWGRLIGEGVGNCRDCPLATPVIQAMWSERVGEVGHRGQLIFC